MSAYEFEDSSYAFQGTYSSWIPVNGYDIGVIFTAAGIVRVMLQGDDRFRHFSSMDFFHDARIHHRNWNRRLTRVGAARCAARFSREIAEANF